MKSSSFAAFALFLSLWTLAQGSISAEEPKAWVKENLDDLVTLGTLTKALRAPVERTP